MSIKKLLVGIGAGLSVVLGTSAIAFAAINTVTVYPGHEQGWAFINDQTNTPETGVFVNGPGTPPLGSGSAQLTTASTSEGHILAKAAFAGTKLADISALSYATYQAPANPSNATAIALQFNVDKDVTDADTTFQGRIVYEPYQNNGGTVPQGTWTTWDAINGGNAKWWFSSQGATKFNNTCTQAVPCTWNQIKTLFPNVGVHPSPTLGAVVFKAGSGWSSFNGNVDAFSITTGGNTTTFNFELNAPTVSAPAITSPANNSVVTTSQLNKIDWTDATTTGNGPVKYQYQAFSADPAYTASVYDSGPTLTSSEISTAGTPEGTYYVRVRAIDADGNTSAWSNGAAAPYKITVKNSPTKVEQCYNNGWKNFSNPAFVSQNDCIVYVAGASAPPSQQKIIQFYLKLIRSFFIRF